MKRTYGSRILSLAVAGIMSLASIGASAQSIYGNTFPFWNVNGPLTVVGATSTSTLAVTSTSVFTGAITANGGVVGTISGAYTGTTTNDSAAAGKVGELLTTTVASGSAVSGATSTTQKDLTSVSLTAGDWDVSGTCDFLGSTLIATVLSCGLGTTTDTQASQAGGSGIGTDPLTIESFASQTIPNSVRAVIVPPTRVSLSATTIIHLVAANTFSSGTYTMYGTIRARRVR